MKVPGQWIEPEKNAATRAANMLKSHPNAAAVWVGHKTPGDRIVSVFGRDGRQEQLDHHPVETFAERLEALAEGWPTTGSAEPTDRGDVEAAAQSILNA